MVSVHPTDRTYYYISCSPHIFSKNKKDFRIVTIFLTNRKIKKSCIKFIRWFTRLLEKFPKSLAIHVCLGFLDSDCFVVKICHISVTMLLAVIILKIKMENASIEILRSLKISFVPIIKLIKLRNSGCGKSGKAQ